jgi:hypothetical protein
MSIEKQDNWRQKLLDLDNLPGDTAYDREIAWHQLQSRLQPAPRRKKAYWYWAAAALVVLIGWPLLVKKTTAPAPISNMAKQQVKKTVSPVQPIKKESPAFIIISGPVAKKTITQKASIQQTHTVDPIASTALPDLVDSQRQVLATATIVQADSPAVRAKPDKKLSVVHINELETAAPELAAITEPVHTRWRIKHALRSPTNQLVAAQKGNDGIINIKLSSKN